MDKNTIKDNAEKSVNEVIKKLKEYHYHDEKYAEYESMISSIHELYKEIVDESDSFAEPGIYDFCFDKMIEKSPFVFSGLHSKKLWHLQLYIYYLARVWDIWVYAKRREKSTNPQNLSMGVHLFFLSKLRERDNRTFYVKTFNKHLPQDKRLVAITIPVNRFRLDYTPIMHEMGHVIGCRSRKERKYPLFEFLLLSILNEIYKECMSEYGGLTPGKPIEIPYFKTSGDMGFFENKWWQYSKNILAVLEIIYNNLMKDVGPEVELPEGKISYADKYVSDKCVQIIEKLDSIDYWTCVQSSEYNSIVINGMVFSCFFWA